MTIWITYTMAHVSVVCPRYGEFHIRGEVIYKCEAVLVPTRRQQIWASYVHGCNLERDGCFLHLSEWGYKFCPSGPPI